MPFNSKSNKASSPLVKIEDVPDVPTIGTAVTGPEEALVAFTPAITGGKAALYRALSTPGSIEGVGATSPILVTGLEAGTSYTFQVRGETNLGATTGYSSASNAVVPETSGAYELIESNILTSTASSVTFSSIPQDYKHLQIRMVTRSARTNAGIASLYLNINGDTSSSSYSMHNLTGDGSSVASGYSAQARIIPGETPTQLSSSGIFGSTVIDFLDYSVTTKNKTTRALSGLYENSFQRIELKSGLWISTAAITSMTIAESTTLGFVSGSRFSLYGIRG